MALSEGPHHGGEEECPPVNGFADKPQSLGQIYANSFGDESAERQPEEQKNSASITSVRDYKSMFSK